MECEILFRGKRLDNGEWVYGVPLFDWADCSPEFKNQHKGELLIFYGWDSRCQEYYEFEVDPATVGQYTGLTDKNGKKIFVGDIVKCHLCYDMGRYPTYTVKMETAIIHTVKFHDEYVSPLCRCVSSYEVIGNIHDNPELLEVQG